MVAIDYGALVFSSGIFEVYMSPLFSLMNLFAGVLLVSRNKYYFAPCLVLLMTSLVLIIAKGINPEIKQVYKFMNVGALFIFYGIITVEIIYQVWTAKNVSKNVIMGLIGGYMSLAFIGFFICLTIEMIDPGSFKGLLDPTGNPELMVDRLKYYSYITIMTIGYGDIVPVSALAQKGSMLIGLVGQFYLVIITSTIVGKFVNQSHQPEDTVDS
jgi:hypothetical protein